MGDSKGIQSGGKKAVDVVAANRIWSEHIKRERDLQAMHGSAARAFRVNMKKIVVLPPKAIHIDPRHVDVGEPTGEQKILCDKWRLEIERTRRAPKEKFYFTQTESHEIGWMMKKSDVAHKKRSRSQWKFPRQSTDIVKYSDNYCLCMGYNPYTKKA